MTQHDLDAPDGRPDDGPTRSELGRARRRRRRRRLAVIGSSLLALVLALAVTGYVRLNGNITRLDISQALGTARPTPTVTGEQSATNILLIGSDQRVGLDSAQYGKDTVEGGPHSDTNMLVHVSADRSWAMVVSIPRDSMVESPQDCTDPKSAVDEVRQWNQNFNQGGPACVIRALEANTRVFVNHFAVVNFNGFRDMVDALGGVDVCLKEPVKDADSQFELAAGRHHVDGTTALGYVRVRKSVGDGSDLGRIKRQQAFMSSVIQEATQSSLLLRPDKLYAFLSAATASLTTDSAFGIGDMRSLASALAGIGLDKIEFYTVPTEEYAPDRNRVQWTSGADQLWTAMRDDVRPGTKPGTSATPTPTPTTPLTVTPTLIDVDVVNDSGVSGYGAQATQALLAQGFRSVRTVGGNPADGGATVHFAPGADGRARTVAAAFPGSKLVQDATVGARIVVHLGRSAPLVVEVPNRVGDTPLPTASVTIPTPSTSITGTQGRHRHLHLSCGGVDPAPRSQRNSRGELRRCGPGSALTTRNGPRAKPRPVLVVSCGGGGI